MQDWIAILLQEVPEDTLGQWPCVAGGEEHILSGAGPGPERSRARAHPRIECVLPKRRVCSARYLPKVLQEIFKGIPENTQELIMEFSKHRWGF